ncbi:MAG: hypothetical protein R3D45_13830 [Rhizobiaceae bacterium]
MNKMSRACALAFLMLCANDSVADETFTGEVVLRGSEVRVIPGPGFSHTILTIVGPDGFHASASSDNGSPSIDLIRAGGTGEGEFTYEVTAATDKQVVNKNPMDNGRGGADESTSLVGASTFGSFRASGGIIEQFNKAANEN